MKVLILGANGMLGHITYDYFKENGYEVFGTALNDSQHIFYDAFSNMEEIDKIIEKIKPNVVINCIGILNQAAETNKPLAVKLNSLLPHYLDSLSEKHEYKFIHVSTDCVFSGKRGQYNETDFPDAESFYGKSKALGEVNNDRNLTLRTSIVGPDINEKGIGLFNWFMKQSKQTNGYTKVIWSGVTTLQLAKLFEYVINNNLTGLHIAVNNQTITKYELLKLFAKYMNKDIIVIPFDDYIENKSMVNSQNEFERVIPSYDNMVQEMCEWIKNHSDKYERYFSAVEK